MSNNPKFNYTHPEISIIVPIYSIKENYLRFSIESVLEQTYVNFELILIDDGSPDESGKICEEYAKKDKRIVVLHKENQGVSAARNDGIELSKGNWIMFLDPDDFLLPGSLSILLKKAEIESSCIVFGEYQECKDEKLGKIYHSNSKILISDDDKRDLIFFLICRSYKCEKLGLTVTAASGSVWGKLFKTELIKNNGIKFDSNLHPDEDILFLIQLIPYANKVELLDIPIVGYRIHNESVLRKMSRNVINNDLYFLDKIEEIVKSRYGDTLEAERVVNGRCVMLIRDILKRYYVHPQNDDCFFSRTKLMSQVKNHALVRRAYQDKKNPYYSKNQKLGLMMICRGWWFILFIIGKIRYGKEYFA